MTTTTLESSLTTAIKIRTIRALQTAICRGLRRGDEAPFLYFGFATPAVVAALDKVGVRLEENRVKVDLDKIAKRNDRLRFIHEVFSGIGIKPPLSSFDRGVSLVVPKFDFEGAALTTVQDGFKNALSGLMALGLVEGLARCEQVLRMRAVQAGENVELTTSPLFVSNYAGQVHRHPEAPWCDLDALARVVELVQAVGVDTKLLEPQLFCFKSNARKPFVAEILASGSLKVEPPEWWRKIQFRQSPEFRVTAFRGAVGRV